MTKKEEMSLNINLRIDTYLLVKNQVDEYYLYTQKGVSVSIRHLLRK